MKLADAGENTLSLMRKLKEQLLKGQRRREDINVIDEVDEDEKLNEVINLWIANDLPDSDRIKAERDYVMEEYKDYLEGPYFYLDGLEAFMLYLCEQMGV